MPRFATRSLALLSCLLAGLAAVPPAPAPPSPRDLYLRLVAGTAWVQAANRGKGTGWVVDATRRWLVTCYHVVGENETALVVFPWHRGGELVGQRRLYLEHDAELRKCGLALRGKVIRRDPSADLALVELPSLPSGVKALSLSPAPARPGSRVHLVGNRYDVEVLWTCAEGHVGSRHTLTDGYFSAGRRLAKGATVLAASLPINEGDSGGAAVNARGEVVGVAAAVAWEMRGAGLLIDASAVRAFLGEKRPQVDERPAGRAADLYRRAVHGVAAIEYEGGERRAGVVVDRERRLVLTTARAVGQEKRVEITFPVEQSGELVVDSRWYRANRDLLVKRGHRSGGTVLAVDRRLNLALVEAERLPESARALSFASGLARPGDPLHLISHPRGVNLGWLYSWGSLRQTDSTSLGLVDDTPEPLTLIVQAPLGSGEEGGPVLDERGELVGIASGRIGPQQQLAFALATEEVQGFLARHRPLVRPATAAAHAARARLFLRARDLRRASEEFTLAVKLDPASGEAHQGRAAVLNRLGKYDLALKDATRAVELLPRSSAAWCERSRARAGRGQLARALEDAERAVRLGGKSALAYACRAEVRLRQGKLDDALRDADEAVWLDGKLSSGYLVRGLAHARQGAAGRALADLTQAVALDPDDPTGLVERGQLHLRRHDGASALADFEEALRLQPEEALALSGRGLIRLQRGAHDGGLADLESALRRRPDLATARLARGGEWLRRGRRTAGVAELLEAAKLDPAVVPEALGEFERRLGGLAAGEAETFVGLAEKLLRGVLGQADRPELKRQIEAGLKNADEEKDHAGRARHLLGLLARVRSAWQDR